MHKMVAVSWLLHPCMQHSRDCLCDRLTRSNVQIIGGVRVHRTTPERSSLSMLGVNITA